MKIANFTKIFWDFFSETAKSEFDLEFSAGFFSWEKGHFWPRGDIKDGDVVERSHCF